MARKLQILDSAKQDLADIANYIARTSTSNDLAYRVTERLVEECIHLAGLTGTLGRPRHELRSDIRSFPFKGYVIFFRYVGDALEVVNILEGHRDIDAAFSEEE